MRRHTIAVILGVLAATPAWGDQTRDTFAYGFTVEPREGKPLWEVSLPDEVYRTVTEADLRDLRVFNRDGTSVPHLVRRPATLTGETPAAVRLAVFPLRGRATGGLSGRSVRVITNDRGDIVSAVTEDLTVDEAERVVAYVIDVGGLQQMPETLVLAWNGPPQGFAATVAVEASDDLARWRTVTSGVTLAEVRAAGNALIHREITLPRVVSARYLRIEWPDPLREVELSQVDALFPPSERPPDRETIAVTGRPDRDDADAYEFDSGGMRPIDRVRVIFEEQNAVLQAILLSRAASNEPWRWRQRVTFYTLKLDGTQVQNPPVVIPPVSDRYWRLEIVEGQRWTGAPPTLEFGWVPHLLTSVAQGDPPFTVAFGSAGMARADRASGGLETVIDKERGLGLIEVAQASDVFVLGGASQLEPPAPPLPWRTWGLWTVLVAGVGLLGWMVRRLSVQVHPP